MNPSDPESGRNPPLPPCARCGVELRPGRGEWHVVEIRTVADPGSPVFDAEDLEAETEAAIGELLGRLRKMTERQLCEQVYARKLHLLCSRCHARWMTDPFGVG
ncbi:MAG: hypothetical protein AB7I30_15515 [Isosphaeraceae bacterium]